MYSSLNNRRLVLIKKKRTFFFFHIAYWSVMRVTILRNCFQLIRFELTHIFLIVLQFFQKVVNEYLEQNR